ncbi:MAG TPA: TrbG/VirB9 family P-type conjugative transfer protein [Steroidobacter sp.]|jgi:type IV secretion system protein VirB9|nr:TrbG/VirB9 family P-type conjugative transfer protein [Steroidobacter sp.]
MKRVSRRLGAYAALGTALALSAGCEAARAELLPQPGRLDSRIRTALYDSEQVYRLHAFVGYQIELVFEEDERFAGQGGGDLEGIAFGAHSNHLILKPRAARVGTNLVIYTNRRAYRIDYRVHSHPPDPLVDEVMYAVRFVYPPTPTAADEAAVRGAQIQQALSTARSARARNYDYWFCGDGGVRPIGAFDDGVHTRFTFDPRAELPVLFVLNDDGAEALLNFNMQNGEVVVHRVARRFIVRRGGLTGCIVNKGYQGIGTRLESGTLARGVRRERKETRP